MSVVIVNHGVATARTLALRASQRVVFRELTERVIIVSVIVTHVTLFSVVVRPDAPYRSTLALGAHAPCPRSGVFDRMYGLMCATILAPLLLVSALRWTQEAKGGSSPTFWTSRGQSTTSTKKKLQQFF